MAINATKPTAGFVPLVKLTYGGYPASDGSSNPTVKRYCRSENDITTTDAAVWTAMPELDVKYKQPLTGGVKKEEFIVQFHRDAEPLNIMVSMVFPRVRVDVYVIDRYEDYALKQVTGGEIGVTTMRPQGKAQIIEAEVWRFKHLLDGIPMGIKATDRCPWILGDPNCQATGAGITTGNLGRIEAIDGTKITMAEGLTSGTVSNVYDDDSGRSIGYYFRGYIQYDDLRLFIRKHVLEQHNVAGAVLHTSDPPPVHSEYTWLNKEVRVFAGCTKYYDHCVNKFSNQAHFGGVGKMMPTYNPYIESPT